MVLKPIESKCYINNVFLPKLNCAFLNCIGKGLKQNQIKRVKRGPTGTSRLVSSLLPASLCWKAVGINCGRVLTPSWCRRTVCVGRPASSDVLWDIGQYAKKAASLLFLWLQDPKVVFFSSYLPDVGFPASLVHLDEPLAPKMRLQRALLHISGLLPFLFAVILSMLLNF